MSFKEQIMSKDKYPSLFSRQMEAIVFIILQIFFAKRALCTIDTFRPIARERKCLMDYNNSNRNSNIVTNINNNTNGSIVNSNSSIKSNNKYVEKHL